MPAILYVGVSTNLHYIHGNINSEIVLGVDSNTKFINDGFMKFTKSSQRAFLSHNIINIEEILKDVKKIWYFGLSFDENDKTFFKYVFDKEGITHTMYFYENNLNDIVTNIKKIITHEKYNILDNKGKFVYRNSNELTFDDN